MVSNGAEAKRALVGGVVAGVLGGVLIAALVLGMAILDGRDVWGALKGAGAPFLGARALVPGFDGVAVLVGVVSHFAVSIAWGVPFGLFVFGSPKPQTVVAGAGWGFIVWIGMYYVVLPVLGLGHMVERTPAALAALEHVVFGLGLGLGFLPYQVDLRPGVVRGRGPA